MFDSLLTTHPVNDLSAGGTKHDPGEARQSGLLRGQDAG